MRATALKIVVCLLAAAQVLLGAVPARVVCLSVVDCESDCTAVATSDRHDHDSVATADDACEHLPGVHSWLAHAGDSCECHIHIPIPSGHVALASSVVGVHDGAEWAAPPAFDVVASIFNPPESEPSFIRAHPPDDARRCCRVSLRSTRLLI